MSAFEEDPTKIGMDTDPTHMRLIGRAVHGNKDFNVPYASEIMPGLWQGGCATGLVLPPYIKHVVSLYPWERYTIQQRIDSELYVTMYDSNDGVNSDQVWSLASWVNNCWDRGQVLVHCQAGLNRSSLVVAAALIQEGSMTGAQAIARIREARSEACLCNPTFERWVKDH